MAKNNFCKINLDEHPELRMSLESVDREGVVIIHIAGIIDSGNSDFFSKQAMKVIEAGYRHLIIDAESLAFMSSTGVGAFTSLLKITQEKQGSITICGLPPYIYEIFQYLGFSSFFQFSESVDEALDS